MEWVVLPPLWVLWGSVRTFRFSIDALAYHGADLLFTGDGEAFNVSILREGEAEQYLTALYRWDSS